MEIAIIIASCYGLLAIMGGSTSTLMAESIFIAPFVAMAIFGFKLNLWLVVAALFAHGVFDFIHAHLIQNRGVAVWWPGSPRRRHRGRGLSGLDPSGGAATPAG